MVEQKYYLIANSHGEFFQKFGFLGRAKYVPQDLPKYALRFKTREDAESFIERKLVTEHHVVSAVF